MNNNVRRMRAELEFGLRFNPSVRSVLAYKQAFYSLAGGIGPPSYTPDELAEITQARLDQARSVLIGSILDQFGER